MTRIVFKVSLLIGFLCLLLDPQGLWGQSFKPLGFQLPEEGIIDVRFDYTESTLAGFQFDKYVKLHKDFDDRKPEAEAAAAKPTTPATVTTGASNGQAAGAKGARIGNDSAGTSLTLK